MRKTQIMIEEKQMEGLKKLAYQRGVSVAQVVREALDDTLNRYAIRDREEIVRKALAAAGCCKSDVTDVSVRHDDYLAEAFYDWEGAEDR